jgi:hypothetical protein
LSDKDIQFLKHLKELRNGFYHEISFPFDTKILIGLHIKFIETLETIIFEPWFEMA